MRLQAAFLAFSLAMTAIVAHAHDHLAPPPGLYDGVPDEGGLQGDGPSICSICRLAHETSSVPVSPGRVPEPLPRRAARIEIRSVLTPTALPRQQDSRGPPTLAAC